MSNERPQRPLPSKALFGTGAIVATLAIFVISIVLPEIHIIAALYVVVVVAAGMSRSVKVVVLTAVTSIMLVWLAPLIDDSTGGQAEPTQHLVELAIISVAIALTALVVVAVLVRESENAYVGRALLSAEDERASEKRMLAAASSIASIGTWSVNPEDNRFDWSEGVAGMHGLPPNARPTIEEVFQLLSPEDSARMTEVTRVAFAQGLPYREEIRLNRADGTKLWVAVMGGVFRGDETSTAFMHGTIQDITYWKETEIAAPSQDNRLAQLTRSLPIVVWSADAEGHIDYFNDALLEYTGVSPDDLLGDAWVSAVDPRDVEAAVSEWKDSVATGRPYDIEYRVRGADGVFRWHHLSAQPERDDAGHIIRWWGNSINVDAIRMLQDEATATSAERELVLESITEGVYALDESMRFVYVNSSSEAIFDHTRDDLVGHIIWDVFPGLEQTPFAGIVHEVMEHKVPQRSVYKSTIIDKWLDVSVTPKAGGVTVFMQDLTEIKSLSEQLAQSQRLESIGQLTGGIAHDFNNLLTVVLGGADALLEDEAVRGETREMVETIAIAAERGAELTHRLLAFARKQPLEPFATDLNVRLRDLEPLLRRTFGEHIALTVTHSRGAAFAQVDQGQYDNAVINLALNARDAMPHGGSIIIETETVTVDGSYVALHPDASPGTYVVTTVTDSGEGIAQQDVSRLFDPFFTTKETGKGSGLGLAMVWGFVGQSGGHITVSSDLGVGSSFMLYLPCAEQPQQTPKPTSDQIPAGAVSGSILVAEDDDLVRRYAADRLRSRGYEVVEAGSGPEALRALSSMERLDLLFTDVIMPGGMSGRDLAEAVLRDWPGTPVLYASGYAEDIIVHDGRLDDGVNLLTKPYSGRQLAKRVGELLVPAASEGS